MLVIPTCHIFALNLFQLVFQNEFPFNGNEVSSSYYSQLRISFTLCDVCIRCFQSIDLDFVNGKVDRQPNHDEYAKTIY